MNNMLASIVILVTGSLAPSAMASIYNAESAFDPSRPTAVNGVWSYLHASDLKSSPTLLPDPFIFQGNLAGYGIANDVPAIFTALNGEQFGVGIGEIGLHGRSGQLAVLRFTAPTSGSYSLAASWEQGHTGLVDIFLRKGMDDPFHSVADSNSDGNFTLSSLQLSVGETVDLIVGPGSDGFAGDTTPANLEMTLATVPEPATFAMWSATLISALLLRYRKVVAAGQIVNPQY